jgi:hypothetical protein
MQHFLFRAQDRDMTSGDYAFFTFTDVRTESILTPWLAYNITQHDIDYRLQAFAAVKQVRQASDVDCQN